MSRETHYIGGKWIAGQGEQMGSVDPSNGESLWEGNGATEGEVNIAVEASRNAQPYWSKLPLEKRIEYIVNFQKLLEAHKQNLAEVISKEVGKPLWESLTEVGAMIGKVNISIQAFDERCPTKKSSVNGTISATRHKPHGSLAVFGPYNFPGHLPNGHIIPALLAGNTVIFKPSELTPLVAEETIKLWEKAGIPRGVIQLIQGNKSTAVNLSLHKGIDGLLFTGSWETGSILSQKYVQYPGKILALELGGNNPLIVHECSNLKAAAYTVILSAYFTSGQRCTCARRLIIPSGKEGDRLIDLLQGMIPKINVGSYRQSPEPFMGPLISEEASQLILGAQDHLIANGGTVIIAAATMDESPAFVTPALIDTTTMQNREDKEFFGPLLQVIRVSDFDEAIEEANNTSFGLAAGLLSDSKVYYEEFFHRIRAGIVNWNTQTTGASSAAPFGGVGKSGNFHPSAYYAADYCSYPVASMESDQLLPPTKVSPGLEALKEVIQ